MSVATEEANPVFVGFECGKLRGELNVLCLFVELGDNILVVVLVHCKTPKKIRLFIGFGIEKCQENFIILENRVAQRELLVFFDVFS